VRPPASNPTALLVKWLGPLRRSMGLGKLSLSTSPTPRTSRQLQQQGLQKSYPQWAPRWLGGLLKLRDRRQNPLDGSKPPRGTRARDEATQRMASSWCIQSPIEVTQHSQASDLNMRFPSCPFMWAGIEPSGFFTRIIRDRRVKLPDPNLTRGISPYLVLWRSTCPGWLSPSNSDQTPRRS
jgi:hypothetical protein